MKKLAPVNLVIAVLLSVLCLNDALADKVRILDDPVDAAQARIDLIQQARKTINAQYFIVGGDSLSLAGLALARDAAHRGCIVRIIIDAPFNRIPDSVLCYLLSEGVQIRVYHPFRWSHLSWLTRCMHDKGMTVDGSKMIHGGRNIERSYFGIGFANYVDRDVYVEGEAAKSSDEYFIDLWNSNQVAEVQPAHWDHQHYQEGRQMIEEARGGITTGGRWKLNTGKKWGRGLKDIGSVEFLHDKIGKKDLEPGIAESLRDTLRTAQDSILIETPYCVPTSGFYREVDAARKRGVKSIQIVTNSLASNDSILSQIGYEASKNRMIRHGIALWEFKGPDLLHAKSAVIDGNCAIIGSFNLDPRSEHLNTETAVALNNPHIARRLTDVINRHKKNSWQIGRDGKPIADGESYASHVPLGKRIMLALWHIPLPFIRGQL